MKTTNHYKAPLGEPAVALPLGTASSLSDRPRALLGLKPWMLTLALLLVPLVTYWPATFHDYGLRDDYSNLREAHEEPGKVLAFCASHARPLYGWLLQTSFGATTSVQNLEWLRLAASLLLGAISLAMLRTLRTFGWSFNTSLCLALWIALLPAAQVIAAWAVGWPYALTALLSIAGFFATDAALASLREGRTRPALRRGLLGLVIMVACALSYQPSAMFYVVPLAAALIGARDQDPRRTARWLAAHLALLGLALAAAYATMSGLYAAHVFVKSGRISFEQHWIEKLLWFLREPLPNALSPFVLNDDHGRHHRLYLSSVAVAAAILVAGTVVEWRRHGRGRGLLWAFALLALPLAAFAVSLVAAERYATYRTIFAMTAVLLCFLVASLRSLTEGLGGPARRMPALLALGVALFTAQHHAYALIAVPQGNEWQLILSGAKHVHLDPTRPRIFAIASTPADISTASIYHDEFGSLSSNSEWVPKEMFKRAMHDLHPNLSRLDQRYDFATGPQLPAGAHYDVVVDMRRLHRFFTDT